MHSALSASVSAAHRPDRKPSGMLSGRNDIFDGLFSKHTGLPFVVWISYRGGARHDVRVKVSRNAKALPGEMASVAIRPHVELVEGEMSGGDFVLLREWIEK